MELDINDWETEVTAEETCDIKLKPVNKIISTLKYSMGNVGKNSYH